jgi:hypothetical protein
VSTLTSGHYGGNKKSKIKKELFYKMYNNDYRQELINVMQELAKNGFKCFILKENPSYLYGHVITPNDNVIYIQRDSFHWRGWTFSLQYKPGKKTGSGCQCLEEPVNTITVDIILRAEKEGLAFARRLKATLYKNSQEYIEKLWNKSEFEEVL